MTDPPSHTTSRCHLLLDVACRIAQVAGHTASRIFLRQQSRSTGDKAKAEVKEKRLGQARKSPSWPHTRTHARKVAREHGWRVFQRERDGFVHIRGSRKKARGGRRETGARQMMQPRMRNMEGRQSKLFSAVRDRRRAFCRQSRGGHGSIEMSKGSADKDQSTQTQRDTRSSDLPRQ